MRREAGLGEGTGESPAPSKSYTDEFVVASLARCAAERNVDCSCSCSFLLLNLRRARLFCLPLRFLLIHFPFIITPLPLLPPPLPSLPHRPLRPIKPAHSRLHVFLRFPAIGLLSKFSKSRFYLQDIPSGEFRCAWLIPSVSSFWDTLRCEVRPSPDTPRPFEASQPNLERYCWPNFAASIPSRTIS